MHAPRPISPYISLYLPISPYISQVLGSHLTPNSNSETQQLVDGDLTCAVLQLLPLLDSPEYVTERSAESSNVHLDLALLFFLQQFRKVLLLALPL